MDGLINYFLFLDMDKPVKYLQVIISWPFVSALLIGYFLKSYKVTIENILRNINLRYKDVCINLVTPPEQKTEEESKTTPNNPIKEAEKVQPQKETPHSEATHEQSLSLKQAAATTSTPPTPQNPSSNFVQWVNNDPDKAYQWSIDIYNSYLFEQVMNSIYGSQLRLLDYLLIERETNENNFIYFYNQYLNLNGNPNISFNIYLNFLYAKGLIQKTAIGPVQLTPLGQQFLSYIKTHYPTYLSLKFW